MDSKQHVKTNVRRENIVSPLFQIITTGTVNPAFYKFWACIPQSCVVRRTSLQLIF